MSALDEAGKLRLVEAMAPRAAILHSWPLSGGISAQMTVLSLRHPNGRLQNVIVRQPGAWVLQHNPRAAADEFQILQIMQALGITSPEPIFLDWNGEICGTPALIIEYIEGQPAFAMSGIPDFTGQVARQLARIHAVKSTHTDLSFLDSQADRLAAKINLPPKKLDQSLNEERIRQTLIAAWPLSSRNDDVLLHGDFWPGNWLWRDGQLAAVIDWEDAHLGDPLFDLAITRLDLLWAFGQKAMQKFTKQYQALAPIEYRNLPYWDLAAAWRPAGQLSAWGAGWVDWGRPDVTAKTMRAGHRWFVHQAYVRLSNQN